MGLLRALNDVRTGARTLPAGVVVETQTPAMLEVVVRRGSFAIEYDALAILTLHPMKLTQPFLVPPDQVESLLLRCDAQTLEFRALCRRTDTVSLKEARQLSLRRKLPPGIHHEQALGWKGPRKVVRGGLPSLGKRK